MKTILPIFIIATILLCFVSYVVGNGVDAGGQPYYDLCIENGFKVIKLQDIEYAPEVDQYPTK